MEVLDRVNIETYNTEMAIERRALLNNASTRLGYKPANPQTLIHQLLALGISPYKSHQVEAYKRSKERTGMWSGTRNFYISLAIWAAIALAAYHCWFELSYKGFETNQGSPIGIGGYLYLTACIVFCVGTFIVGFVSLVVIREDIGHGKRSRRYWIQSTIASYEGTVPDYVLNTALHVAESIPNALFGIDHLAETTQFNPKPEPRPDPFLYVYVGSEKYYIEQWDERDLPRIND